MWLGLEIALCRTDIALYIYLQLIIRYARSSSSSSPVPFLYPVEQLTNPFAFHPRLQPLPQQVQYPSPSYQHPR